MNKILEAMHCQRQSDNSAKQGLVKDKATLEECLRQTQAKLSEVQSQVRKLVFLFVTFSFCMRPYCNVVRTQSL